MSQLTTPPGSRVLQALVLGADAVLAAAPASPVQVAHAAHAAGFDLVAPASWGDELVAAECVRRVADQAGPILQCSCPRVAARLCSASTDLGAAVLRIASPPAAAARYLRALHGSQRLHVTFAGGCEGAVDDAIDARIAPHDLLSLFESKRISLDHQPRVFDSVIPPDRRRFFSIPGGAPAEDALKSAAGCSCVTVGADDPIDEIAQILLSGERVIVDASVALGCACAGASAGVLDARARERVTALEPPRSSGPVVDARLVVDLAQSERTVSHAPVPAAVPAPPTTLAERGTPSRAGPVVSPRRTPGRGTASIDGRGRNSPPTSRQQIGGTSPQTRDAEGRQLPRTYVARRRTSPRGIVSGEIARLSGEDGESTAATSAPPAPPAPPMSPPAPTATVTRIAPPAPAPAPPVVAPMPAPVLADSGAVVAWLFARPLAAIAGACALIFGSVLAAILIARAILS